MLDSRFDLRRMMSAMRRRVLHESRTFACGSLCERDATMHSKGQDAGQDAATLNTALDRWLTNPEAFIAFLMSSDAR
jgi:hypothetical protein